MMRRDLLVNRQLNANLIALVIGASFFVFSIYFLIIFVFSAYSLGSAKRNSFTATSTPWVIISFCLLGIFSSLLRNDFQQLSNVLIWVSVSVIFYKSFASLDSKSICRSLVIVNCAFCALEIYIIGALMHTRIYSPLEFMETLQYTTLVVPNDFAYFVLFLPLFRFAIQRSVKRNYAIVFTVINSVLFFAVSIILESRLALVGLSVYIVMSNYYRTRKFRKSLSFLLPLIFIGIIATIWYLLDKSGASIGTRLTLWFAALYGVLDSPLAGHGVNAFGEYYDQFKLLVEQQLPPILPIDQRYIPWPHNFFMEIIFAFGCIGVLPIFSLIRLMISQIKLFECPRTQVAILTLLIAATEMTFLRLHTVPLLLVAVLAATHRAGSRYDRQFMILRD